MTANDPFVSYVAGFFDGEGSIDIRYDVKANKNGKSYERFSLRVCVVQMDRTPLDMIAERWGGSVSKRTANNCHTWVATTASACSFLSELLPYLIVKRREAEIGVAFQATMRARDAGVERVSDGVRQQRYDLMIDLRNVRLDKGVFARPRANVPETRGVH